jgi:hypothetical protein
MKTLIAAAKNRDAGILIASGTFLFVLAIGVNTIYSVQYVCLDMLPPQCYSGYDSLGEFEKALISPGLYIIGALVAIAGALVWLMRKPVLETNT